MTPKTRRDKVSHPGYGKVEGFNYDVSWFFDPDPLARFKERDRKKERQKQYESRYRNKRKTLY